MWPMMAAGGAMAARDDIKWYMDRQARKRAARNLWEHQQKVLKNQIRWMVKDAQRAGIHPLAALGVSPAGIGTIGVGQHGGTGAGEQMMSRALAQLPTKNERRLQELAIEEQNLRNDKLLLENIGLNQAVTEMGNKKSFSYDDQGIMQGQGHGIEKSGGAGEGVQGTGQQQGTIIETPVVPGQMAPGLQLGVQPAEQWTNVRGRYFPTLNQTMTEAMESNFAFKWKYYMIDFGDYFKGWSAGVQGGKSKAYGQWMRYWRPKLPPNSRGKRWEYSTAGGFFYQVPKGTKERTSLQKKLFKAYRLPKITGQYTGP